MMFSGFNGPRTRNSFYLGPLLSVLIHFGNQLGNFVSDDLLCIVLGLLSWILCHLQLKTVSGNVDQALTESAGWDTKWENISLSIYSLSNEVSNTKQIRQITNDRFQTIEDEVLFLRNLLNFWITFEFTIWSKDFD